MSVVDYVILPKEHYVAACDKVRERTGKTDLIKSGDLATEIEAIPAGGGGAVADKKYVNFYDYDGTLLYSYDADEVAAMTELPPLPTQKGLICQGWNWTLADIQTEGKETNVGATYVTDDGKTRLYITVDEHSLDTTLRHGSKGAITVDWGDGTCENLSGADSYTHVYTSIGDYTIAISSDNTDLFYWTDSSFRVVSPSYVTSANAGSSLLKRVCIGLNCTQIGSYAFQYSSSLTNVTIPNNVVVINSYMFRYCYSLTSVVIPSGIVKIGSQLFSGDRALASIAIPNSVRSIDMNAFNACATLMNVTIPNGVGSIDNYAFDSCYILTNVTLPNSISSISISAFGKCYRFRSVIIPNRVESVSNSLLTECTALANVSFAGNITSVGAGAFNGCCSLSIVDFTKSISVPTLANINAFTKVPTTCEIRVPAALYDEWIAATNWSTYADQIVAV